MADIHRTSLHYLLSQPQNAQWSFFLQALAEEMASQMPPDELRIFFQTVGKRIARSHGVVVGDSLSDLQEAFNAVFSDKGWGWCVVSDGGQYLEILHGCAPLRQGFGDAAMPWVAGLLEGMYSQWLLQMGAGSSLKLQQVGEVETPADVFTFHLAP
jgi:hypothetical protein